MLRTGECCLISIKAVASFGHAELTIVTFLVADFGLQLRRSSRGAEENSVSLATTQTRALAGSPKEKSMASVAQILTVSTLRTSVRVMISLTEDTLRLRMR